MPNSTGQARAYGRFGADRLLSVSILTEILRRRNREATNLAEPGFLFG